MGVMAQLKCQKVAECTDLPICHVRLKLVMTRRAGNIFANPYRPYVVEEGCRQRDNELLHRAVLSRDKSQI